MTRHIAVAAIVFLATGACSKKKDDAGKQPPAPTPPAPEAKAPPDPPAPEPTLVEADFQTPESVLHETGDDVYLVTNINGDPLAKDGNGFISRVSPDGQYTARNWIASGSGKATLNAPKGIAVLKNTLYVTDIDVVRKFHRTTAEPLGEIPIKGATFLNDVAAGPDTVYVSDSGLKAGAEGFAPSGTDAIYAITEDDKVTKLIAGDELGRPNGLLHDGTKLWVVTFGTGELYSVTADGKRADIVKLPKGQLDGIVSAGDGTVLISSWEASAVYRGPPAGPFSEVVTGTEAPADIAYDAGRKRLVIPLFTTNGVRFQPL